MDNQEIRTEEAFQIEKNAKNKAYAFILSNGLQHKFSLLLSPHPTTQINVQVFGL